MEASERRFRAMGGHAHVVIVGGSPTMTDAAERRLGDLEARWSRFRPTSELSLLNGMPGIPIIVSSETYELIEKAVFGWRRTRGRFDPTVLEAVIANGYDRSFDLLGAGGPGSSPSTGAPGCGRILLDPENLAVTLPQGVGLDPGGIGKGLAADIVVRELLAAGAAGAMVNLGGDVRVAGQSRNGDGWTIVVEDPFDASRELSRVHLVDGAVATSSRLLRRWRRGDTDFHHLVDPRTGAPLAGDIAAVTVVAGAGWWAEVMSKAVFAAGVQGAEAALTDATALIVDIHGERHTTPGFTEVAA